MQVKEKENIHSTAVKNHWSMAVSAAVLLSSCKFLVFLISGDSRPFKDPVLEFPEYVIKSNFNNYKLIHDS